MTGSVEIYFHISIHASDSSTINFSLNFVLSINSLKKADEDHLKTVQELKVAMLTGITGNRGIAILFYGGNGSNNISAEKILEKSFDMRKFAEQDFHYIRYTDFRGASSQVSIGDFKESEIKFNSFCNESILTLIYLFLFSKAFIL